MGMERGGGEMHSRGQTQAEGGEGLGSGVRQQERSRVWGAGNREEQEVGGQAQTWCGKR